MAELEVDKAEKAIADLRKTVSTLESDVAQLSSSSSETSEMKKRSTSELITQALLKVDSIQISKDLAADLLRSGQRDKSRKVAVLLARRKTIVKKLNALGDAVDKLALVNNEKKKEEDEEEKEEEDVEASLPAVTATTSTTTTTETETATVTTN